MYNYENLRTEVRQPAKWKSQKSFEITYQGIQLQLSPNLSTAPPASSKQLWKKSESLVEEYLKKKGFP